MDTLQMPTTFALGRGTITVLLSGELTDGRCELFDFVVPPGQPGPGRHVHETSDELFNVLEGEGEFQIGNDVIHATAGARVVVPRGSPHTWRNVGHRPLHLLVTFTPAIRMAEYFAELSAMIAHAGGVPPREAMEALWGRYDTAPA